MPFTAGQFIMLSVPYKNTFVRRAYSIASPPRNGTIEICLNYIPDGTASNYLFGLKGGETLVLDGPWGVFRVKKDSGKDKLFVATGTGIAPLRAMVHDLFDGGVKEHVYLVFGERTEEELLYRAEFEELMKKYGNFHYIPTLSRAQNSWRGEKGYVQDAIKKYINKTQKVDVYICGLKEMVDDVTAVLRAMGVGQENIFTETFV